jgi:predicted enzyme related to lactoylglutathione lyase
VEDLEDARHFYRQGSTVFRFGETLVNLLGASEASGLVAPTLVAPPGAGVRFQFTRDVGDVDRMCDELTSRGAELLNGPMDRPWGIRTASSATPADTSGR